MKHAPIVIAILFIGLFAILLEFQSSMKVGLMGGPSLFKYFLIFILVVVALVYLFVGIKHYIVSKAKNEFVPFFSTLILLAIIYAHIAYRDKINDSKSVFKAYGIGKIEGRETTELDFKTDGNLKVWASYKFDSEYYWGHYERRGDTVILDVKTDFKLGNKAIIAGDTLRFEGDNGSFYKVVPDRFS